MIAEDAGWANEDTKRSSPWMYVAARIEKVPGKYGNEEPCLLNSEKTRANAGEPMPCMKHTIPYSAPCTLPCTHSYVKAPIWTYFKELVNMTAVIDWPRAGLVSSCCVSTEPGHANICVKRPRLSPPCFLFQQYRLDYLCLMFLSKAHSEIPRIF